MSKWQTLIQTVAARYNTDSLLRLVQMTGCGRQAECYFCSDNPNNIGDYSWLVTQGGAATWEQAAETIAGYYETAFTLTPCLYSVGRPIPASVDPDNQTMGDVVSYLYNAYDPGGWRFGIRWSGYRYNGEVAPFLIDGFTGYQQATFVGDQAGREALQLYQEPYNARWFEVYQVDCQDQNNWPDFDIFNTNSSNN